MYIPRFFSIEELVHPDVYEKHKERGDRLFMAFDPRALITLDRLRDRYGPTLVNTWHMGGEFQLSGLRPMDSGTGVSLSQHIFGRAFDCKFKYVTAQEVRSDMRDVGCMSPQSEDLPKAFQYIARIEDFPNMNWFHFDTGNHDFIAKGVKVFGK